MQVLLTQTCRTETTLPAVRSAAAHDFIVADGTSCRHQIRDLSGREAIHSVRLMERSLEAEA